VEVSNGTKRRENTKGPKYAIQCKQCVDNIQIEIVERFETENVFETADDE